ncbi:MmgE/PrpD family protein [Chloroflexota bacterium]
MDASYSFAKHIVKVNYNDIPGEAIEMAKRDILDTLGVAIAGSNKPGGKEIMELVGEWGGKEESTVIMFGQRVPSPYAALVNGTMAHALDYDDVIQGGAHVGISVIPAAFAIAERKGKVNGKDFLAAVILGFDIHCRLGQARERRARATRSFGPSFLGTALYGFFGATASAGKLLGLDEEQMVNAFGIAYSQAAGNFQAPLDGALTKRIQPGFASKAGVLSALMASKGLTGAKDSFEGKHGLFPLYHQGDYDPARLVADLGKHFSIANVGFKPYPCCGETHTSIDATLALVSEHNVAPEDVDEVSVHVGELARDLSEPLEVKQKPRVFVDAQFSIPWTVATALVKRKVKMEDFTPEAITNPAILQVAQNVKPEIDPEVVGKIRNPSIVEIKMKGSDIVYSRRVDIAKGDPTKPMSWEELIDKFKDCASCGRKPLSNQKIEGVIQAVSRLEQVDDVGKVIQLLG